MENQAAKRNREEEEEAGSIISMDDRLSELPQPMLHHILSFLSQKQSIQTCVLAKSWRHLGPTRPKLEFSQRCIPWPSFLNTFGKTLQRYEDHNLSIHEFLLEVTGDHRSDVIPFLEKWIPTVLSLGGVKRFYLNFCNYNFHPPRVPIYALPQVVFQTESIQELSLVGCRLNKISSVEKVMLKNLHTLSLSKVDIEEGIFYKIMSGCPLIQNLCLHMCPGLRTVKVKNAHILKNFRCHLYSKKPFFAFYAPTTTTLQGFLIGIDAPTTIQSIRIGNCLDWYWYHNNNNNNKCFPNLKSLHMERVRLSTESFNTFSSKYIPCLEDLELAHCYGFEELKLSNHSIKRLIIIMARNNSSTSVVIDAPNILYFKFSCGSFCEMPSTKFSFTKPTSCEWKSDISVACRLDSNYYYYLYKWFLDLDRILKALSQSQITLEIKSANSTKGKRVEGTFQGFNGPVVVRHLSLWGSFTSSQFPGFLNYLFSICRPRYIYHLPELYRESLCKVLVQERERMDCLWQQDLEDISTEAERDYDGKEWPHFSDSSLSKEKIRLRLKWRELS